MRESASAEVSPPMPAPTTTARFVTRASPSAAAPLLRREPLTGVEADGAAVEHGVLDDRDRTAAVLLRATHPLREGGVLGERRGELIGDALGEPGGEEARGDGV